MGHATCLARAGALGRAGSVRALPKRSGEHELGRRSVSAACSRPRGRRWAVVAREGAAGGGPRAGAAPNEDIRGDSADGGEVGGDPTLRSVFVGIRSGGARGRRDPQPLRTCQMITAPPRKQAPIEIRLVAV